MKAIKNKKFNEEIVPLEVKQKKETILFKTDEQPRKDTSLEALSLLQPVFKSGGTATAGNSSSLNDGAAIAVIASENMCDELRIKPLCKIRSYATVALDPNFMGLGSYFAARKCLERANLSVYDVDLWEINEAFATSSIAVMKLLKINEDKVNVNGGAIALGHPIGASGARILATLVHEMKKRNVRYGVASLCIGGGQGVSLLIENV